MKQTISHDDAVIQLYQHGEAGFSREGAEALIYRIEEYEEGDGSQFEFDPVSLACQFTEYQAEELIKEYGYLIDIEALQDSEESAGFIADEIANRLRDILEVIQLDQFPYSYIIGGF